MRKLLIAGNWKMNKIPEEAVTLMEELEKGLMKLEPRVEVVVAPTFLALTKVIERKKEIKVFAQNCYHPVSGAYTGEISAAMLRSSQVDGVIIGHSERRQLFNENNFMLNAKLKAALKERLTVIYCLGETLAEREAEQRESVIYEQLMEGLAGLEDLDNLIIAYEPVWAIGTGKTATPEEAQEVHLYIRKILSQRFNREVADKCRILYGGSVKADNIQKLLIKPDIDGALIGGASLKAAEFLNIITLSSQL